MAPPTTDQSAAIPARGGRKRDLFPASIWIRQVPAKSPPSPRPGSGLSFAELVTRLAKFHPHLSAKDLTHRRPHVANSTTPPTDSPCGSAGPSLRRTLANMQDRRRRSGHLSMLGRETYWASEHVYQLIVRTANMFSWSISGASSQI